MFDLHNSHPVGCITVVTQHSVQNNVLYTVYMLYLVVLQSSGVQRPTQEELGDDAAQRPHVDGLAERQPQNNLWRSEGRREKQEGSVWSRRYVTTQYSEWARGRLVSMGV